MKFLHKRAISLLIPFFTLALTLFLTSLCASACSGEITMYFETFGGTQIQAISTQPGEQISSPQDPQKEGFVFTGWYLNENLEGERQTLPKIMPQSSVTYYARFEKYPTLTLNLGGGTLAKTSHYVKEGTQLMDYLSAFIPQKTGFTFGGWLYEGEAISEEMPMPAEDISLSARYIASYKVELYLQSANAQEEFSLYQTTEAIGWEGASVSPEVPSIANFIFYEQKSTPTTAVLSSGNQVFRYYFQRKPCEIIFLYPDGKECVQTFYGANFLLPQGEREGAVFFGWASEEGAPSSYRAGDYLHVEREQITLYSVWAQALLDGRGSEDTLLLSEVEQMGKRAVRLLQKGVATEGELAVDTGIFTAKNARGKIDGRGYFLLDDSGEYRGYNLKINGIDEEKGRLILDFFAEKATYLSKNGEISGEYEYLFEEGKGYVGRYCFTSETEQFSFLLKEQTFLKEGEEKSVYYGYDQEKNEVLFDCYLILDGLGNATLYTGGESEQFSYVGTEKGWLLQTEGGMEIFTCASEKTLAGVVVQSTPVFLEILPEGEQSQ